MTDAAQTVAAILAQVTGRSDAIHRLSEIGGGSISRAFVAETKRDKWFVKVNDATRLALFEAEADGLHALAACPAVRVPAVAGCACHGDSAGLVLEYVDMRPLDAAHGASAGRALAELHRLAGPDADTGFGWRHDNFIGSSVQPNHRHGDWAEFFRRERLLPQLALARRGDAPARLLDDLERLIDAVPTLLAGHHPAASLVHGDLWAGNAAVDGSGRLVLFDPAVHRADREVDLAMSELFGGFPPQFRAAYLAAWPLPTGHAQRRTLYNLYHVLNHFNLFGGGYVRQAQAMVDALLAA